MLYAKRENKLHVVITFAVNAPGSFHVITLCEDVIAVPEITTKRPIKTHFWCQACFEKQGLT